MNSLLITFAMVISAVSADPAVVELLPFPSAAYAVASPYSPLTSVPGSSLPYTAISDYRYSYGSGLSYQDYAPVALSGSISSLPYTLPYAYAADWYYRK